MKSTGLKGNIIHGIQTEVKIAKARKQDTRQANGWDEQVVKCVTTQCLLHLKNKYLKLKPRELKSFWIAYSILEKLSVRFPELSDVMLQVSDIRYEKTHTPERRIVSAFEACYANCPTIHIDRVVLATGSRSVIADVILHGATRHSSVLASRQSLMRRT